MTFNDSRERGTERKLRDRNPITPQDNDAGIDVRGHVN